MRAQLDTAQQHEAQRSIWQLAALLAIVALGLASAVLYYRALVSPYLLTRYVAEPLLDLGKIGGYDPEAGRRYTIPLIGIWLAYLAVMALAPRVRDNRTLVALAFGGTLVFSAILLWLYPITAADIFNYALYGLVQHRGENPLVLPPNSIIGDPLIGYSAWPGHPSPYGPVWQGIAWLVTAFTGERLLAGIILFKVVLVGFHLLNIFLIARIAAASGVARPGLAALLYGWNPLLLYETVGNGHNDIVMLTGLLLALWALTARRSAPLTLPLATLAALAKYVGGLWLPVLALGWLPEAWQARRWRAIVAALLGSVVLVVLCYLPFWEHGRALEGVSRQANLYTTSLGGLAMITINVPQRLADSINLLSLIKSVALVIIALVIVASRPRNASAGEAARATFDVTLAYLLVGALWFQPWYLVPLVGLIPLVDRGRRAVAICYALGATGSYVVYFYLWPALAWTPDRLVIQTWAVAVAHGPAWAALAVLGLWTIVRRGAERHAEERLRQVTAETAATMPARLTQR